MCLSMLELRDLGFDGVDPAATGRPAYHPSPMLKLYIYGYLNRVQSSRRLERAHARDEHRRYQTVPRGDPGMRSVSCCTRFVTVHLAQRGPRLRPG
jgi:transposase